MAVTDGRPPMLSGVEEFLDRCPTASRDRLRHITDDWFDDPTIDGARASHNAIATGASYRSNPLEGPVHRSGVYLVDTSGTPTINPGSLLDPAAHDVGRDDYGHLRFVPGRARPVLRP